MAKNALVFGLLLIALGVVAFLLAGATAKVATSLIPAGVGIVLLLLSAIARKSHAANKHAMHVAALLSLLGGLGGLGMGIPNIIKYFKGDGAAWLKALTQGGMGVLCIIFLVLCIKSFIDVRRARQAAA